MVIAGGIALASTFLGPVASAQTSRGTVAGRVLDAETQAPIEFVQVLIEEANRSSETDGWGSFLIRGIPAGDYTFKTFRIGYEQVIRTVRVERGDTLRLTLHLSSIAISAGELIVEGTREQPAQLIDAAMELEGRRLRQQLGTTIAETLDDEPGIAMRSMGPAPARPVLRGLGGERLLVLEDGERTGDLSASSADHALVVDPMTAERIEVIRGPAALVFGSNTLGGVVNVVRGLVPTAQPDAVRGVVAVQGQSVNAGVVGGGSVSVPIGAHGVVRADGTLRGAGDVRTPEGTLGNTAISTGTGSLGGSLTTSWGYVGLGVGIYDGSYGIPGGFVGAHPNGVRVEVDRRNAEFRWDVLGPFSWVRRLEFRGSYTRYHHREYEAHDVLGISYGVISYHGTLVGYTGKPGGRIRGAAGVWSAYRDFAAGGFSSTAPSVEWTGAGFAYQDLHLGTLTLQGGIRVDARDIRPKRERDSPTIGPIRERRFGGASASATVLWHPVDPLVVGWNATRSLRMPAIEELFSEGPHLAAYAFEVGNPALNAETGVGLEAFARYQGGWIRWSAAVYRNAIEHYIFPLNTGAINHRVHLPIYQYTGARALLWGGEARADVRVSRSFGVEASASAVRGTLTGLDQPIPWMPPPRASIGLRFQRDAFTAITAFRLAARQERLGPFEEPTPGFAVLDAFLQYHFTAGGALHTVDLGLENAGNATYRDHLSRVKTIMPEAGRNLKLLYRFYF